MNDLRGGSVIVWRDFYGLKLEVGSRKTED